MAVERRWFVVAAVLIAAALLTDLSEDESIAKDLDDATRNVTIRTDNTAPILTNTTVQNATTQKMAKEPAISKEDDATVGIETTTEAPTETATEATDPISLAIAALPQSAQEVAQPEGEVLTMPPQPDTKPVALMELAIASDPVNGTLFAHDEISGNVSQCPPTSFI